MHTPIRSLRGGGAERGRASVDRDRYRLSISRSRDGAVRTIIRTVPMLSLSLHYLLLL